MPNAARWVPGGLLVLGCVLNGALTGRKSQTTPLLSPIDGVAESILGVTGTSERFSEESEKATGMSSYVYRKWAIPGRPPFSVYVGYYEQQEQGKTIHSPKNCLPGQGWEPVESRPDTFTTSTGPMIVNRYRVAMPGASAVVYYWYQGRGRIEHNELLVKYQLLRDAVLRGRTEEALVRVIIPIENNDVEAAYRLAHDILGDLATDVQRVLPPF